MRNSYRIILGFKNIKKVLMKRIKSILQRHCQTRATRVWLKRNQRDSNNTSAWQVLHEQQACDKSATRTTQVRYMWKIFLLITTRLKTCFHTPILAIWRMKEYKERNNFIPKATFCKCLVPMSKCVSKVHYKNWTL